MNDDDSNPTSAPPRPVLAYAPPSPGGKTWYRHTAWCRVALGAAIIYAVVAAFISLVLGGNAR